MAKVKETNIDALIPDDLNANKGSEYGQALIERSLRHFGAGRSILLDKNNRIIAGNKTIENAASIGLEKVLIIETTGDQVVAVKRTDIDLDSKIGREMAIADNATAKANIEWDENNIQKLATEFEIETEAWGIPEFSASGEDHPVEQSKKQISTKLIVECESLTSLNELFMELQERGFRCELKE
jgi:hypothetical protein